MRHKHRPSTNPVGKAGFLCAEALGVDSHVTALHPCGKRTRAELQFVSCVASRYSTAFGHGHSISNARLSRLRLVLPATPDGEPDWDFMNTFMRQTEHDISLRRD